MHYIVFVIVGGNMQNSTHSFIRTRKSKLLIPIHSHKQCEFVYFFSGSGIVEYNGNKYEFSEGSYYFMNKGVAHSELYKKTGMSIVVWFDLDDTVNIPDLFRYNTNLNISGICEQIREELKNRFYSYKTMVDHLMRQIVVLLERQMQSKSEIKNHSIRETIYYIDEYFMTKIKVSELAKECGYSSDHYRCLFKSETKMTPKDYISMRRIKHAKELLKNTKLSVDAVCERCGFETYSQFVTFFKKKTRMTPKQYRQVNHNSK